MSKPAVVIEIPRTYAAERTYAVRVVVGTFLGYEPLVRPGEGDRVVIRVPGDRSSLAVSDGLFATPATEWLKASSLPSEPIEYRDVGGELPGTVLVEPRLPILYNGHGLGPLLERDSATGAADLRLDVFGAVFFALTRYEERTGVGALDEHDRFPAEASLAHRARFLRRPIANEYAEVLAAAMRATWPRLPAATRSATVWLTHDVDWPLVTVGRRPRDVVRSAVADVVARRSPGLARRRLLGMAKARRGDYTGDPGDTFDFLMTTAEAAGLRATFNFLAGGTAPLDGRYQLADPWIRGLLRKIAGRGHELGFHGSYESYDDPHQLAVEFSALRSVATALGIEQAVWSGRQHFLRWANPLTWQAWDHAGLNVDSSVYFARAPGFRTGSCRPYPVFDLDRRAQLSLVEAPLTLMDVSATRHQGLDEKQTLDEATLLYSACRTLGGTFVLLWHNDAVMTGRSRRLYADLVGALV